MENKFKIQPVITEKTYAMANAMNKYTFLAPATATKIEVAKLIEKAFNVKVISINSTVKPGKMKRDIIKYKKFRKPDMKKVVVELKKGDKIESFLNI